MKFYRIFSFIFTSIATGLAAAFILVLLRPELIAPEPPPRLVPAVPVPAAGSYADAVAAASPAVVNIFAVKLTKEKGRPIFSDPLFQQLFGNPQSKPRIRRENSLGSGLVVDENGYILTNHHVIEGASQIRVVVGNEEGIAARVVGTDPETDLAVLQVGGNDLPAANLGHSSTLRVGDVVLAIGNPFAVGQTVTQGIVSATGRHELGIANFENFIQTDAAINPGNSGGALINIRGEVVGINTAIFSSSGGSHGIGFAIPIDLAREVMTQIIENGRVIRGWIGISGQDLTPALAESLGLDDANGVLVSGVLERGPADQAGIAPGDVIQSVDGKAVGNANEILNLVSTKPVGGQIQLELVRDSKKLSLTVEVIERPSDAG